MVTLPMCNVLLRHFRKCRSRYSRYTPFHTHLLYSLGIVYHARVLLFVIKLFSSHIVKELHGLVSGMTHMPYCQSTSLLSASE